jgi:acyl-coenzyme A synthetase/AMP-(fatty) acid ligase
VHIYASTEAGVGFQISDGKEGFPVSMVDRSVNETRLRVDDEDVLWIRPTVNEQRCLDPSQINVDKEGFINTGDVVLRSGDRFKFLGRSGGVINVGGRKVHPQDVESLLQAHEDVQLARVSARPNPFTGSVVQAEVVPSPKGRSQATGLESRAIAFCREHLEPFQVPAVVKVVDKLDLNDSGKIVRK